MKRKAMAAWSGNLKEGRGTISTDSGVLSNTQYGFNSRFEEGPGTNPEELIAAAHAGCFTMAVSAQLADAGITADSLKTTAAVTLDKVGNDFVISAVHLDLIASIPGVDREAFDTAVNNAKVGCPVSKVLNATITLNAKLEA
ncbi:MAG TPA: OsmC family protein [Burkholderiaceae bacterium]|nr:OsmC family protein [Burkholderiaceae bacterium]